MQVSDRDGELVGALRRRVSSAAERLVSAYGDRTYRLALRITGSAQDAEEVAQDALWTVISRIDAFRGESAFGSWLYRIVANGAYQRLRRRRRRGPEVLLEDVVGEGASGWDRSSKHADPSLQDELGRVLRSAIDALPADYRIAVMLHDVDGLSNRELAQTLGISLANAKSRVHRARLLLRQRLAYYMETPLARSGVA